jgi:hypothetical protein
MSNKPGTEISLFQSVIAVLWPSFLTAGVATIILFTVFDPVDVSSCMGGPEITRLGAYSIGFFMFWLLTSSSCLLALYFKRPCPSIARTKSDPA